MSWPVVLPSDVADLWRPLTADEEARAAARIALVEAELRAELRLHGIAGTPEVGEYGFATSDLVQEWVVLYAGVVAGAALPAVQNPEGWLEETDRLDDFATTRRRDRATSSGGAAISSADVAKLLPRRVRARGSFTIRPGMT